MTQTESDSDPHPNGFGPNTWVIDEMYRKFVEAPESVSETWREFFADYKPDNHVAASARSGAQTAASATAGPEPALSTPETGAPSDEAADEHRLVVRSSEPETAEDAPEAPSEPEARAPAPETAPPEPAAADAAETPEVVTPEPEPIRGAGKAIVTNMEASLSVPTATSVRTIPAKLLEENRRIINDELAARGAKVSFTHLIGWAIVRALAEMPGMNVMYDHADGEPARIVGGPVNLGLAVDQKRKDGTRTLLVPNIKNATALDFAGFVDAYEDVIRRVREGKIGVDDFAGTTVSITNPGMLGTNLSVPRLMQGQAAIIGVGSIDYPPGLAEADRETLTRLGVSKILTLTSTYDHRVIQGAESGEFLGRIEKLLIGDDDFYEDVFRSLGVRMMPVRWRRDVSPEGRATSVAASEVKAGRVLQLINMYRVRGHLVANLNPLETETRSHPELEPDTFDLTLWDLDRSFFTGGLGGDDVLTLREILERLRAAYCETVGIEYMHIQDPEQKRWIQDRVEGTIPQLPLDEKQQILHMLNCAEGLESFLGTKYIGTKRFSLEGTETTIPMLDALLTAAGLQGIEHVVIGMAHRGRLNVLANILAKSLEDIFGEFEGAIDPDTVQGSGDVKYHLGAEGEHMMPDGRRVGLTLAPNPSHLEAVDPIVEGLARGLQSAIGPGSHKQIMPVLLHGDAAFAGQGVVAETLNLSQLRGYRTGGTVHLIVNNVIGFTTPPEEARTGPYATDVAKMIQAPIFHVNAEDPEAAVRVMKLAAEFRQEFDRDIVIDLIGYRRHGHNEADDPSYTQPVMYEDIDERNSVRKMYTAQLANRGDISLEEAEAALGEFRDYMQAALEATRAARDTTIVAREPPPAVGVLPHVETGVDRATLDRIVHVLTTLPDDFHVHDRLERLLIADRAKQLDEDRVDWALAEQLAIGSLLIDGTSVRMSGQDTSRGTFSQRHAVFVDQTSGEHYRPLQHIVDEPPRFRVYDSSLSEYAALGFEYGYSVVRPDALVVWEAQFGDFSNGAQIVIDQYIVSGDDKWGIESGLTLLLPHGFEGQGPEHSSARIERFLTLAAEDNIQVTQPTNAGQYFHLLRRQKSLEHQTPLVVFTPKSLLRLPAAASAASAFTAGSFEELLVDQRAQPEDVKLALLCSGKVFYDLEKKREDLGRDGVALLRVEQLYPFPRDAIRATFGRFPALEHVRWVQDEPDNMGAWAFAEPRVLPLLPDGVRLSLVSRRGSGSPATGSATVHKQEQEQIVTAAFGEVTGNRLEGPHPRQL